MTNVQQAMMRTSESPHWCGQPAGPRLALCTADRPTIVDGRTSAVEPRIITYSPEGALRIKGRPVVQVEYCATLGTVGDIALVDLKKYRLIRKGGVEQASSYTGTSDLIFVSSPSWKKINFFSISSRIFFISSSLIFGCAG